MINVKAHGATGNGSTDDTRAVQSAINAVSGADALYFPAGVYKLTAPLTMVGISIHLYGDGHRISILHWASTGGLTFSTTNIAQQLIVSDLTLETEVANGGTAISGSWPSIASSNNVGPAIRNVEILGTTSSAYWTRCIDLANAFNGEMHDCFISSQGNRACLQGIRLTGNSTDFRMVNCEILFVDTGVEIVDTTEGVEIVNFLIVSVRVGIYCHMSAPAPLLNVSNSHISALAAAISIHNKPQASIQGNLLYQGAAGWLGIYLSPASGDARIGGNQCLDVSGESTPSGNGVVIAAADGVVVVGNNFRHMTTGVWVQTGSTNTLVTNNVFPQCPTLVFDQGTNSTLAFNV